METIKENNRSNKKYSLSYKDYEQKNQTGIIEIVNEEELKKIEAYLEWEQEYYIINQSYLLENI